MDVAFICTGNICRSPMAEAILRARLAERSPDVSVGSAGLLFDGREAEDYAVRTMAKMGLDISDHRSRKISVELLGSCSLILGMTRQHVREVASLDANLFARSFTLPELVHAAALVGPRQPGEDLRGWAERIGRMRSPADYAYADPANEIPDPMGGSMKTFRACAERIEQRIDQLIPSAWPHAEPSPGDPVVAQATPGGRHADRHRS